MSEIGKKELEHLADLARVKLDAGEEKQFLRDLEQILAHFNELKDVNTENVIGMAGGTSLRSVFRVDGEREETLPKDRARASFPEEQDGYLKSPHVFE